MRRLILSLIVVLYTLGACTVFSRDPENFYKPVIPGFYPDPSICWVDDTFYVTADDPAGA